MIAMCDVYWAAGLLEGEGSFAISSPNKHGTRTSLRIDISMTDRDIVERLANVFGFGSIYRQAYQKSGNSYGNGGMFYRWQCTGCHAAGLMMTLYPLLGKRRQEKVEKCLDFWRRLSNRKRKSLPGRKTFSFSKEV